MQNSHSREKLKEQWIKKRRVEIDFSIDKMVSCYIRMATQEQAWKNSRSMTQQTVTPDQFVLNIVKFDLTMEFAEVPVSQFVPPPNFSPVETQITDAEISKRLSKGVIVNTTTEPNDYASRIFMRVKRW